MRIPPVLLPLILAFPSIGQTSFQRTGADVVVTTTTPKVILSSTLQARGTYLILADGAVEPDYTQPNVGARMHVRLQQTLNAVTNNSTIEWITNQSQGLFSQATHSFNCLGLVTLGDATVTFELYADVPPGAGQSTFNVKAGSGLAIQKVSSAVQSILPADTAPISVQTTSNCRPTAGQLPTVTVLSHTMPARSDSPVTTLASCTAARASGTGDTLVGIYHNSMCFDTSTALWSVQDLWDFSEYVGPMFCHTYRPAAGGDLRSLEASKFIPAHSIAYIVRSGARLVSVLGSTISGSAPLSIINPQCCPAVRQVCWASSTGSACPLANTPIPLVQTSFITAQNNENVLITAKARMQANHNTGTGQPPDSGRIFLWITVDGIASSTLGQQEIRTDPAGSGNGSDSQRTLSTTVLMGTESTPYPSGTHVVTLWGFASTTGGGSFHQLGVYEDQVLVYFN